MSQAMSPSEFQFPMARENPLHPPAPYARLRTEQPVAKVKLWEGTNAWVISRHGDARQALRDPRFSADLARGGLPPVGPGRQGGRTPPRTFPRMDPPEHTLYRQMLTHEFMGRRLEEFRPAIEAIVEEQLDDMAAVGPPVDLVTAYSAPTAARVICLILGVPYDDQAIFDTHSNAMSSLGTTGEDVDREFETILTYLDDAVKRKEVQPSNDLISRLLVRERAGELSRDDLVNIIRILIPAGYGTTANMLSISVLTLLKNPNQLDQLRQDPGLQDNAVEELLRHQTVLHMGLPRVTVEQVEIDGQTIPAGEGVLILLPAANRDDEMYADPDDLDLTRKASNHLAFGYGVHMCLGHQLARMELRIGLRELLARFPTLNLASEVEPNDFKHYELVYGINQLNVTW